MKLFIIKSLCENKTLYQGQFSDFKTCVEQAVVDGADITGADFKHQNLMGANLDDADFSGCDFSYANLTNANLSETLAQKAIFHHADMYNTCLADSNLSNASFIDTSFGATQIQGADLSHCIFSTMSCFSLPFSEAQNMEGAIYTHPSKAKIPLTAPPIVIHGLQTYPVVFLDEHIITSDGVFNRNGWIGMLKTQGTEREKQL